MVETLRFAYTRLFEVRILHHYWLDEGATAFDNIADDTIRTRRLLTYDVRKLIAIQPSPATAETVAGLQGVFRMTGLGFLVATPEDANVPLDASFEFYATVTAPDYANYTSLSLRPQPMVDVVDPADTEVVHRYKANVPVLSNLTGASTGTGANRRLFLSQEYLNGANTGDGVEALVTSGNNLRQLTGDPPGAPFHVLGSKSGHPVYVHQGDVPPIVPPAGSSGAPAAGIEMTMGVPPTVAFVMRLTPRRADNDVFSFANANGTVRTPVKVFQVHLRNRWSTWRYRNRSDGSVTDTESDPLPLTYFGNAGSKQKPSTAAIDAERDSTDPSRIVRLVSDIYV